MSSISPQKGTGFFKDFLNKLSGRKLVTKRLFRPRKLTEAEERRKEVLEQKKRLTKKQKRELNILSASLAPKESEYQRLKYVELRGRPPKQKAFNIFYENETPKSGQTQGFVTLEQNYRKPLRNENLAISNDDIPEPTDVRVLIRRTVNGREMNLPRESQRMGLLRMFSWFYEKAFKHPTATPQVATETEVKELQQHVQNVLGITKLPGNVEGVDDAIEKIAVEVFGSENLHSFNEELRREETGDGGEKKIIEVNGQYYVSETYGGGLARYLKWFFVDYKRFYMVAEFDEYQCWPDPDEIIDWTNDNHPQRAPLTTLKSNRCISLYNNLEAINELVDTDSLQSNWMVIDPLYFPEVVVKISNVKKDLTAKYFQQASFIQDALDNWGVTAMDPLLWKLFETKYPEIAIKLSTYIFTNFKDKVPLYLNQLKYTENFIVVDESIEFEKNTKDFIKLTTVNPFTPDSPYFSKLRQAAERKKLYGVTPYIAYFMKKTVPELWNEAFESRKLNYSIYEKLNAHEKIAIDYLQYLRFRDVLISSGYDFVEARDTYKDFLGDGNADEGIVKDILELYGNEETNDDEFRQHQREMVFFQSLVTRQLKPMENHRYIVTPADITALLNKFASSGIDFSARRNRFSALAEAVTTPPASRPRLTVRADVRNQQTQIQSRLNALIAERKDLLKNSPFYNAATNTRKNRNEVNRMYKSMIKNLGPFSRFTKSKNRKNLEIKRNVAKATFNKLESLNRTIQNLQQQLGQPAAKKNAGVGTGL